MDSRNTLGVQIAGYLEKKQKSRLFGSWVKRYYVLTTGGLFYFKRDESSTLFGEERGFYDFKDMVKPNMDEVVDEKDVGKGEDSNLYFQVRVREKNDEKKKHVMRAEDVEMAEKWRTALHDAYCEYEQEINQQELQQRVETARKSLIIENKKLRRDSVRLGAPRRGTLSGDYRDPQKKWPEIVSIHAGVPKTTSAATGTSSESPLPPLVKAGASWGETIELGLLHASSSSSSILIRFGDGTYIQLPHSAIVEAMDDAEDQDEHSSCFSCLSDSALPPLSSSSSSSSSTPPPSEEVANMVRVEWHSCVSQEAMENDKRLAAKAADKLVKIESLKRAKIFFLAWLFVMSACFLSFTIVGSSVAHDSKQQYVVFWLALFLTGLYACYNVFNKQMQTVNSSAPAKTASGEPEEPPERRCFYLTLVCYEKASAEMLANAAASSAGLNIPMPNRYINAEKGDQEKALARWKKTLQWRKAEGIDRLLEQPHPKYLIIKKYYPHFIHKTSKLGDMMYYEQLGGINMAALEQEGITIDDLLYHYKFLTEYIYEQVCTDFEMGKIVTVLDVEGVALADARGPAMQFVRKSMAFVQAHYPERSKRIYLVNIPWWFDVVYKIFSVWMDPVTLEKTVCKKAGQFQSELLKYVDADKVPAKYGGTCTCSPGACNRQSPEEIAMDAYVARLNNPEECAKIKEERLAKGLGLGGGWIPPELWNSNSSNTGHSHPRSSLASGQNKSPLQKRTVSFLEEKSTMATEMLANNDGEAKKEK